MRERGPSNKGTSNSKVLLGPTRKDFLEESMVSRVKALPQQSDNSYKKEKKRRTERDFGLMSLRLLRRRLQYNERSRGRV